MGPSEEELSNLQHDQFLDNVVLRLLEGCANEIVVEHPRDNDVEQSEAACTQLYAFAEAAWRARRKYMRAIGNKSPEGEPTNARCETEHA